MDSHIHAKPNEIMNIKNLVNTESITITNCEDEPIHIPGSIQPHGFLLGVEKETSKIIYCSENCGEYFGLPLQEILDKSLDTIFLKEELISFDAYFNSSENEIARSFIFTIKGTGYSTSAHIINDCIVLEFEPFSTILLDLPDLYIQTKRFSYYTERADNLKMLCQDIANETKSITGYDRIMIYRFDEQYNGEVFAESKNDNLKPFLGLHYPHTDIPAQARALYMSNKLRILSDVNYKPVPLYGLSNSNAQTNTLDLSMSTLRSFSPIHVQYLQNMGVGATLAISLIHKGKLWGMIVGHHYSARHIPYSTRLAAHLQAVFLSSQIDVRQVADEFEYVKYTDKKIDKLHEQLAKPESEITKKENLLLLKDLINADGVIVYHKEKIFGEGSLPNDEYLGHLLKWLQTKFVNGSYKSSELVKEYPEATSFIDHIAGLYALSLGKNSENCIIWTLKEKIKKVNWAGNPDKAIVKNEETNVLAPRNSFATWTQSIKNQSREWRQAEKDAALEICAIVQTQLHLRELKEEEVRYQNLNEKLQKANDELSNMNWISTHDLKEPLRKIQIYASIILEKDASVIPESVKNTILRMQSSAGRMQMLIEDLLSYNKVINSEERFKEVDLNEVLEEVNDELKETLEEKEGKILSTDLPIVQGVKFQIRQLFINLISNSIKFAKENEQPIIKIDYKKTVRPSVDSPEDGRNFFYHCITISDNGIGFDDAYKEDIFKVFHRLHTREYKGSGVGLAICKKIIESYGGFIEARSEENRGAIFTLYFPK
jgi:light-regulated signal transduction histidine kinase (bacteriophytochrome)